MNILITSRLKVPTAFTLAAALFAVYGKPAAAMPASSHLATGAGGVIAVSWRGHVHGVSHGERERALIAISPSNVATKRLNCINLQPPGPFDFNPSYRRPLIGCAFIFRN